MGADSHPRLFRLGERVGHDLRIAGMKTAGDIDRGDDGEHRRIVAHLPVAEYVAPGVFVTELPAAVVAARAARSSAGRASRRTVAITDASAANMTPSIASMTITNPPASLTHSYRPANTPIGVVTISNGLAILMT